MAGIFVSRLIKSFVKRIVFLWNVADEVARDRAVVTVGAELEELEHLFTLLVLGGFIGLPSPPMQISLELLPVMEKELEVMVEKVDTAFEPLSRLFSVFEIG